ncbi:MAG: type II secretion system GspH family protein [Campylobacter sp.]|uniref:type II secretion system protein n=1 Tax=Campylobacter sp. TaxID=205 RepID=UPI002AA61227|nr:type II secretion system protein [Campylobacter sp.]MCI6343272.1 type II secretion system GspH family protein [Campylobacter sp.]
MKKGFTMIELIFVIVILGILASVAIPRLAATREDAEISAAVANLRTLISDINSYYVVKGTFTGVKWKDITNVPTTTPEGSVTGNNSLKVGGQRCIDFLIAGKNSGATTGNTTGQTHIVVAKFEPNKDKGVCTQVQNSEPLKTYFSSTVNGVTVNNPGSRGAIAIGSSISIYDE